MTRKSNTIRKMTINRLYIYNVIGGLTVCFSATKEISDTFSFLWNNQKMSKYKLKHTAATDISREDLVQEINHIRIGHNANFGRNSWPH